MSESHANGDRAKSLVIGIDVGGTFTDFVMVDEASGGLTVIKTPSTPHDPSEAVVEGLAQLAEHRDEGLRGLLARVELIVHGTTVATNAVLTRSGAPTAVLTTAGFRDMLEIRRGIRDRRHLYDNKFVATEPLVPRELRFGVRERIDKDGRVLHPLDPEEVRAAAGAMQRAGVATVAIALMHSYANPSHEQEAADLLREEFPDLDISISSEVANHVRLYPRLSTTVLNSYVRPPVGNYLRSLERKLQEERFDGRLLVMQSNGGVAGLRLTERLPATTFLSGPAGGPTAAALAAEAQGHRDCVLIDMGGTSFEASVIRGGAPSITAEGEVGGLDLSLPFIDIHTIGAGGGSVAWLDEGSILHVGPQSAGASPGPAAYGEGGEAPTCTDANVVLGYVNPENFLGGRMRLDASLAEAAIETHVAGPLGISVRDAARGIFEVINFNMASGIREITTQRGFDPREFVLVAAGGAGAIHAATIAEELGIAKVIIPRHSSVLCASGMLGVDLKHDYFGSHPGDLDEHDLDDLRRLVDALVEQGGATLEEEGVGAEAMRFDVVIDMRYAGQHHEIPVATTVDDLAAPDCRQVLAETFDQEHDALFGFALPASKREIIALRVTASGARNKPELGGASGSGKGSFEGPTGEREIYLASAAGHVPAPIFDGDRIAPGVRVVGPAVIETATTTILVPAEFTMECDHNGSYVLTKDRNDPEGAR